MESCTSGLIATLLTNVEGSSNILSSSAVTYSNYAKELQGVSKESIEKYSVYSKNVASEMARNSKLNTKSYYGIGVTGLLDRLDPANPDSTAKNIYYAINYESFEITKDFIIPDHIEGRFNRKLYTAYQVGLTFFDLLYAVYIKKDNLTNNYMI
jgi:PncC family amidohydrolase